MNTSFEALIQEMRHANLEKSGVIPWSSPIPVFGDVSTATLATVGLNPSNREFVDVAGSELKGTRRRFHTLSSLELSDWSQADAGHIRLMIDGCCQYFSRNPYDGWFKKLDKILAGTTFSFYGSGACHLDLVPYSTSKKWTALSRSQRVSLLSASSGALELLLRESNIRVLVLNGKAVVQNFEEMSEMKMMKREVEAWSLSRSDGRTVMGASYRAILARFAKRDLPKPILVLGYNHNIQSSFGVTNTVVESIGDWVADEVRNHLSSIKRSRKLE